jgi:hypothetical protein
VRALQDPERRLGLAQVMEHPGVAAGGALPPLHGWQQAQRGQAAAGPAAGLGGLGGGWDEEAEQRQQEQLLREALQGLVGSNAPVLSFSRGEQLMSRGEPGGPRLRARLLAAAGAAASRGTRCTSAPRQLLTAASPAAMRIPCTVRL